LQQGGVLNFNMSATPNKARGTKAADVPYSLSNEK
jgi:putative alpha-1,2-mannosidase